jgi:hypothetical protein
MMKWRPEWKPDIVNDSGHTLAEVEQILSDDKSVVVTYGDKLGMRIERAAVENARVYWAAARRVFTPDEFARERESVVRDIEAALPETTKKRPRKSVMNKLMADLVAWHAIGLDS